MVYFKSIDDSNTLILFHDDSSNFPKNQPLGTVLLYVWVRPLRTIGVKGLVNSLECPNEYMTVQRKI